MAVEDQRSDSVKGGGVVAWRRKPRGHVAAALRRTAAPPPCARAPCTAASARALSRPPSARRRRRKRHGAPLLLCTDAALTCALAAQAALYGKLQAGVLARRAAGAHDEATLELSAKLLELNPEVLTAWNLRRDALDALLPAAQPERAAELLGTRLLENPVALIPDADALPCS